MTFRCLLPALAIALTASLSAVAQNTAVIQGSTVDFVTGKPVPGAVIMATTTVAPITSRAATSSADGSFQIPSLPAGTYNLCVQVPRDGYLSTCHWGGTAVTVTLTAGQRAVGTTLRLKAGSVLKIHVDDAAQLLNQKTKEGYLPDLVMGVWNSGMFYPAHATNKGLLATEYQITVPFDTALKFSIQSRRLNLGDVGKTPLTSNADQQSFAHAANAATPAGYFYSVLSLRQ